MLIHHMGETVDHARLIKHYRHMARVDRGCAGFWRARCRAVIHATRDVIASLGMARAA